MTRKEASEMIHLSNKWATGKATHAEMIRAMALHRKDNAERKTKREETP